MQNRSSGNKPTIYNFGINGQSLRDEEAVAYARQAMFPNGSSRFFVRRGTLHSESGQLYNPRDSDWGRGGYELKEVNETAYQAYLNFLRSGNDIHYYRARRELS